MRFFVVALLALLATAVDAQSPISSKSAPVVFYDVNVVSMENAGVLEHQSVVTQNGKITAMGPVNKTKFPKASTVIQCRGKFLMPGLAEMHAHVPPIDDMEPMKEVLSLFLSNGITTIRGMLGHPRHLELRSKLNAGEILGPHFYTTGPSFNGMSVTSPEAGADMVRRQKQAGYDYLKLHPGLSRAKFDSIAATAKRVGIPFAGHVSFNVGVWRAIEAGYSSIDHMDGFVEALVPGIDKMVEQQTGLFGMFIADKADTSKIPALVSALKTKNIWVVPTQSLAERWFSPNFSGEDFKNDPDSKYMKAETIEQWTTTKTNLLNNPEYNVSKINALVALRRQLIRACDKNGVGLLLGCDAPQVFNVPGFSTHNELEYLVRAGLTPYQALRTGTVNVAKYLGKTDSGMIRTGYVSDLILLNGNPLNDIRNTKQIEGVMINDSWMDRTYLNNQLSKLKKN